MIQSLRNSCLYLLVPLLCAAAPLAGRAPTDARSRTDDDLGARAPAASGRLDALAWLSGRWVGQGLGGDVEELWSKPAAGSMIGMFRLVEGGKPGFFQFSMIEEKAGAVTLRFKHFNPDYTTWEKAGPLEFKLTEATPGRAVFESPDPKQTPARVVYDLREEKGLSLLIESPQALGGPISFDLLYKRAD